MKRAKYQDIAAKIKEVEEQEQHKKLNSVAGGRRTWRDSVVLES